MPIRLTRATLDDAVRELGTRDRRLAGITRRYGPPPLWARPRGYATLALIILEQQVSLASARSAFSRLRRQVGEVTPEQVLVGGPGALRGAGLTRQKSRYLVELAQAFADGTIRPARLARQSDEEVHAALVAIPGVGPWTARIYLLMALRRPDVWPVHDLALREAYRRLTAGPPVTDAELESIAERWRPLRSVAARMLWHFYLSEKGSRAGRRSGGAS